MSKLILASGSPRRRELLSRITSDFEVHTKDVDEQKIIDNMQAQNATVYEVVEALAMAKAKAVFDELKGDNVVVIGSDTAVVLDDKILGKPQNKADANRMLSSLSGRKHSVITAVAIISNGIKHLFYSECIVQFNDYDDIQKKLIESYINTNDPYDKAGGYGIQSDGMLLINKIDGDFYTVMGLPVSRLNRELEELGIVVD